MDNTDWPDGEPYAPRSAHFRGTQAASAQADPENREAPKLVGSDAVVVLGGAELREAQETLCRCAQLLQGWHSDGTAWSEWDRDVEKRLHSLQQRLEAQSPQHNHILGHSHENPRQP